MKTLNMAYEADYDIDTITGAENVAVICGFGQLNGVRYYETAVLFSTIGMTVRARQMITKTTSSIDVIAFTTYNLV